MNLTQHYDRLWQQSLARFEQGDFVLDDQIDNPDDKRFGITLLLRPDQAVKNRICRFIDELEAVEPEQYYYPDTDFHITVMSVISCYTGFSLEQIDLKAYARVIRKVLKDISAFTIDLKGITASPSCIMLQGYPQGHTLDIVRDRLREYFKATELEQSIDQRYTIQTAHSTVMRFRKPVQQKQQLLDVLKAYRTFHFGTFKVGEMALVFNDWYQKNDVVQTLAKFDLTKII